MCTFWTSCSHVCEPNISWKVLENEFCESWKTLEFSLCNSWKVLKNSILLSVRTVFTFTAAESFTCYWIIAQCCSADVWSLTWYSRDAWMHLISGACGTFSTSREQPMSVILKLTQELASYHLTTLIRERRLKLFGQGLSRPS